MKLRPLLVSLHRDFGYALAGLTLVYALSGLAVNHVADWNPSYEIRRTSVPLGIAPEGDEALATAALARVGAGEKPRAVVRVAPQRLKVFLENRSLTVDLEKRVVEDESVTRRPGLFEANFLHLNHGKGVWTWVADLYAVGLVLLVGTGLWMRRGPLGVGGRGKWLVAGGLGVPLAYLLLAR